MAYTDEQIQQVCDAGYEIMGKFTDVQNCMFPSTAIMEAMKTDKTAEEIGMAAYDAVAKLPRYQAGFGLVNDNRMHNYAMFLQNEVTKRVEALSAADQGK